VGLMKGSLGTLYDLSKRRESFFESLLICCPSKTCFFFQSKHKTPLIRRVHKQKVVELTTGSNLMTQTCLSLPSTSSLSVLLNPKLCARRGNQETHEQGDNKQKKAKVGYTTNTISCTILLIWRLSTANFAETCERYTPLKTLKVGGQTKENDTNRL
jgi:hypothetical protein